MAEKEYIEKVCSEIHNQTVSHVDEALDQRHGSFSLDQAVQILDAKMKLGRLFLTV